MTHDKLGHCLAYTVVAWVCVRSAAEISQSLPGAVRSVRIHQTAG